MQGVLVMAYGSPERPEDLEAYYTDIRRGRPPAPGQLDDLRRRYDAIGGLSPLAERTRAQAAGLQRVLDGRRPGRFAVRLGLKHAEPSIEAGAAELVAAGADRAALLVLAPHHSSLSVGQYLARASAVLPAARGVRSWFDHPRLVSLLAGRVTAALARLPAGARPELLVTAHSLPRRVLDLDGSPSYPEQLHRTGELVAAAAGVASWRTAWQSAGRTPEPWLGPDIRDVVAGLPGEGFDAVVVCPAGFTSDHLEVLYDVDIEARAVAEGAGLRLERTASLDDDPAFLELLADLAEEAAAA